MWVSWGLIVDYSAVNIPSIYPTSAPSRRCMKCQRKSPKYIGRLPLRRWNLCQVCGSLYPLSPYVRLNPWSGAHENIRISQFIPHKSANRDTVIPTVKINFTAISNGAPNVSTRNHFLYLFICLIHSIRPPCSPPSSFRGSAGSNPIYNGFPASRCRWIFFPKDIPEGVDECCVARESRGSDRSETSLGGLWPWLSKGVKNLDFNIAMMTDSSVVRDTAVGPAQVWSQDKMAAMRRSIDYGRQGNGGEE